MNREIKFRAWDKYKKVFIPNEVWAVVTTDFNAFGIILIDWENYKEGEYFYSNSQVLSQYTGLKDKNGKEIYEMDYVLDNFNQRILVEYDFALLLRLKEIEKYLAINGNYYE